MIVDTPTGLSKRQEVFLEAVNSGENVFLTGKAGTGKSYVTKLAMKQLQKRGKKIAALAPTGIAANNIGGATIHSTFSLPPFGVLTYNECNFVKASKRLMLSNIDVLFIDEVSMLRPDILDAINWTLTKNGCRSLAELQVILIGDMAQLGIVADDNMVSVMLQKYGGTEWNRAFVYPHLNIKNIELDEVLRQTDMEFIDNLNIVRDGKKSDYFRKFVKKPNEVPDSIILAPHNATVQRYNIDGFNSVEGKTITFDGVIDGKVKATDFNLDPKIKVKDGCKIMYLANSKNNPLINGSLGTFRIRDEGTPDERYFIEVYSVYYALEPMTFTKKDYVFSETENMLKLEELGSITQVPIRLAYALTIHKSQGLTFDSVTVDLSLPCFASGQLYVALSRVTTPEGLSIIVNR